eukprot:6668962-Prymnesium_polylepis.1
MGALTSCDWLGHRRERCRVATRARCTGWGGLSGRGWWRRRLWRRGCDRQVRGSRCTMQHRGGGVDRRRSRWQACCCWRSDAGPRGQLRGVGSGRAGGSSTESRLMPRARGRLRCLIGRAVGALKCTQRLDCIALAAIAAIIAIAAISAADP